jgi:hypothetical protein
VGSVGGLRPRLELSQPQHRDNVVDDGEGEVPAGDEPRRLEDRADQFLSRPRVRGRFQHDQLTGPEGGGDVLQGSADHRRVGHGNHDHVGGDQETVAQAMHLGAVGVDGDHPEALGGRRHEHAHPVGTDSDHGDGGGPVGDPGRQGGQVRREGGGRGEGHGCAPSVAK